MVAFVVEAWLLDQVTTVGAVASTMVEVGNALAGPMLPATSVPAFCARVAVTVTPSAQLIRSKS